MQTTLYSFIVGSIILLLSTVVTAGGGGESCKFKGYGEYRAISSANVPVGFNIELDNVLISTKTGTRKLSRAGGYTYRNFDASSVIHRDIKEVFSMLFSKDVNNIDQSRCSIYVGSDNHELFLLHAKEPKGTILVFEYSSIDPTEVYTLRPK